MRFIAGTTRAANWQYVSLPAILLLNILVVEHIAIAYRFVL